MKCPDARRHLYALLDNELDVERNLEVLGHLDRCPECARIASGTRAFEQMIREKDPPLPTPAGLADRIFTAVHAEALRLSCAAAPPAAAAPRLAPPPPSPAPPPAPAQRAHDSHGDPQHRPAAPVRPFPRRAVALVTAAAAGVAFLLTQLFAVRNPAEALVAGSVSQSEAVVSHSVPLEFSSSDLGTIRDHLAPKVSYEVCTHHDLQGAGFSPSGGGLCRFPNPPSPLAVLIQYAGLGTEVTHLVVPDTGILLDPSRLLPRCAGLYEYKWQGHEVLICRCGPSLCLFVFRSDQDVRGRLLSCLVR